MSSTRKDGLAIRVGLTGRKVILPNRQDHYPAFSRRLAQRSLHRIQRQYINAHCRGVCLSLSRLAAPSKLSVLDNKLSKYHIAPRRIQPDLPPINLRSACGVRSDVVLYRSQEQSQRIVFPRSDMKTICLPDAYDQQHEQCRHHDGWESQPRPPDVNLRDRSQDLSHVSVRRRVRSASVTDVIRHAESEQIDPSFVIRNALEASDCRGAVQVKV